MAATPYVIYRSSAGSGKTRTLAREYILLALRWKPDYFRHLLAVTFTNKATQEMKERIIQYLDDFAKGRASNLAPEIQKEMGIDRDALQKKSHEVLSSILHNYSQFSISTIDAFFQRVIRSFTRESGLLGNFRLEVDEDYVLDEVIGALMDELGHNQQLTNWVVQFSRDRLMDGDNWNVVFALKNFSKEIFKEQFKAIEGDLAGTERSAEENLKVIASLQSAERAFLAAMKAKAAKAMEIISREGISIDDFNYKDQGTPFKYFREFSNGKYVGAEARIKGALLSSGDWPSKKSLNYQKLKALAESHLIPILRDMDDYDQEHYPAYKSVIEVLKNYYAYGLISDLIRKLKVYREENNVMLLSDASKFLNGVINKSDTPFIYEKVGSWFMNYLIDEFQDTSGIQWANFIPLLKEAGDQNHTNLIVGDVKQSIYRWRGGDLELLQSAVAKEFTEERVSITPLTTNFRSAGQLVEFNNRFFKEASATLSRLVGDDLPQKTYEDVEQSVSKWQGKGFVRIGFLERGDGEAWKEQVLESLPGWLETLQDKGAKLKEIAILVRRNEEGQRIATYLLQFRGSDKARSGYRYEVVSNESLRLDTASSVNVLISALKFLKNPDDRIARGQLAFEVGQLAALDALFLKAPKREHQHEVIPEDFLSRTNHIKKLTLFEMTEEMIRIFNLGTQAEELAYLQAFQDLVLEFSSREKTDVVSFLEWWDLYKEKAEKSIKVSDSVDAVNILTIHKSKGLQFKYVIVPFCNWRLNHEQEPLLWVRSEAEPFKGLGPLAVKYSSSLEKTVFNRDYRKEFVKAHLDNLNLLYVAFTRAELGVVAFAPLPSLRTDKTSAVGDLLFKVLKENASFTPRFTDGRFEWGELDPPAEEERPRAVPNVSLESYQSADWREKLVIRRHGSEFFEDALSEKRSRINRGILLHSVLSRIEYKADASEKLRSFFIENALPGEEMEAITSDVSKVLSHPQASTWFSKEWKIKAEALVLLPGGRQKRIDRIMLGKGRTVIVDYKTGEKKSVDRSQVEDYATILAQMGYPHVQAYLLYLNDLSVEQVVSKSNLSLF